MAFTSMGVEFALQTAQNFFNFKKGMVINMKQKNILQIIQNADSIFDSLFSDTVQFSEHLYKKTDSALPDMYDHNAFVTNGMPTKTEIEAAEASQKSQGYEFLKINSNMKLPDEFIQYFHLKEDMTDTMLLEKGHVTQWKRNPFVTVKCLKQEDIRNDILEVELRNYGLDWGEDFVRRKMHRYLKVSENHENFYYFGAYIQGKIAGACYAFVADGWTCIDGLAVNTEFRNQYVATTLLAYIAEKFDEKVYLHADALDTPKDMYIKMGFYPIDRCYEYNYGD